MFYPLIMEFKMQGFVIYGFKQTPVQLTVDFHSSTNNLIYNFLINLYIHLNYMINLKNLMTV